MQTRIAPLVLFALAPNALARAAEDAYRVVRLSELELTSGELPRYPDEMPWQAWDEAAFRMPYAVLEGEGEALVGFDREGLETPWDYREYMLLQLRNGAAQLCVRTSEPRELRGRLFLPSADWESMVHVDFVVPAAAADPDAEKRFSTVKAWHYDVLYERRVAGGAWFRHLRRELDQASDAVEPQMRTVWMPDEESAEAYALFSGGRAVSENLQLERELPDSQPGEDVALADIPGITTPAFDWQARIAAEKKEGEGEPELDSLAALVPADQHALFFRSFDDLVRTADEATANGVPLAQAFESRAADQQTRARTERQLCLELDQTARAFGSLAVASVAITGSDPYLRSGSDVAVLFEPRGDALGGLLRARQSELLVQGIAGLQRVEGEVAGVVYHGVVTPDRAISSYLAQVGDAWLVTNSLAQLARIAETAAAPAQSLGAQDEYRFFRQRYARSGGESAFLILPDAAIRRWCGPEWRIATKRRVRAAAFLAEIQARGAEALAVGTVPDELGGVSLEPPAGAPPLGTLTWTENGVHSSLWGSLVFQTPIAELDMARVSKEEARLYGLWRDGYEQNWSRFFDPIAAQLRVDEDTLALDVSVMPLILASEYREFGSVTGNARLAPDAGDRHASTLVHFAMALDTEGETLKQVNESLSAMLADAGVNLLDWLGGSLAIYVEPSPLWEDLAEAEDREEAFENLMVDLEDVPIVLHLDVKSPLKLATFLVALRSLADQTAPGAARWETRSHGEARYVRIASDIVEDEFAIYYATPPGAFVLTLSEKALLAALDRLSAPQAGEPGAGTEAVAAEDVGPWLGESVALDLRGTAIDIFSDLLGEDLERPQRHASWDNLPILNEWKRRFPDRDPLAVHEAIWHERLVCPGGGTYTWNEEWQTMESSIFGHPGASRRGPGLPRIYTDLESARFGLTLIEDGLRARMELVRGE